MVFKGPFLKNADTTMVFEGRLTSRRSYSLPPNPATHRPESVLCIVTAHCSHLGTIQFRSSLFNQALACSSSCPSVRVHALASLASLASLAVTSVQYAGGGCHQGCGKFGSEWWCQLMRFVCTTQSIQTQTARSGPPDANAAGSPRLFS